MESETTLNDLAILQTKPLGIWGKMFYTFFAPTKAFQSISIKPNWFIPFLILFIVALVYQSLIGPIRMENFKQMIKDNPILSSEQVEQRLDNIEKQGKEPLLSSKRLIGIAVFFILEIVKLFALTGIILLALLIITQMGSFIKVLAITSYINLLAIPEMLIKTPLILVKKTLNIHTSLASILPGDLQEGMLFRLLNNFDIFVIWKIFLFSIGLAIISQITVKKSTWLVIYLWIIWVILSTLLGDLVRIY